MSMNNGGEPFTHPQWRTKREVAVLLGVKRDTIQRWLREGMPSAWGVRSQPRGRVRLRTRLRLIDRQWVLQWWEKRRDAMRMERMQAHTEAHGHPTGHTLPQEQAYTPRAPRLPTQCMPGLYECRPSNAKRLDLLALRINVQGTR